MQSTKKPTQPKKIPSKLIHSVSSSSPSVSEEPTQEKSSLLKKASVLGKKSRKEFERISESDSSGDNSDDSFKGKALVKKEDSRKGNMSD